MKNIDNLKRAISGSPKYKLSNGKLFASPVGLHFLDYLDPVSDISEVVDPSKLTDKEAGK